MTTFESLLILVGVVGSVAAVSGFGTVLAGTLRRIEDELDVAPGEPDVLPVDPTPGAWEQPSRLRESPMREPERR